MEKFVIRNAVPADAPAIGKVHVDTWRTAYQGIMPDDVLKDLSYAERIKRVQTNLQDESIRSRYFVADGPPGIVGFVCGGASRDSDKADFDAELYAIYVRKEFSGLGLGKRLFLAWAKETHRQGFRAMKLWVLKENHSSRRFYEAMGGKLLNQTKDGVFGEEDLPEVAYGWDDLSLIKEKS